jgi:alpha-glucosidase
MKILFIAFWIIQAGWLSAQSMSREYKLCSPDKQVVVTLAGKTFSEEGPAVEKLVYSVVLKGKEAILPSVLGITRDDQPFTENLSLVTASKIRKIDENYTLKTGKKLNIHQRANEQVFTFRNKNQVTVELVFRAANDGIAFRYRFPGKKDGERKMVSESTTFTVPANGKAFIHPYDLNSRKKPSYEIYCECDIDIGAESPNRAGWAYPMLFNANGLWMMVTEAVLDGTYCGTHVQVNPDKSYRVVFAEKEEVVIPDDPEPVFQGSWASPWRVIVMGESLATVVETNMVQNLNEPNVLKDDSWIKPGRSSWSWWSDGGSPRSYEKQLKYADFSAEMGWEYMLIDAGWPEMKGGKVDEVVRYAKQKGVGVWLWYHSGAGISKDTLSVRNVMSNPEERKNEFAKLQKWGVKGVKVDFFDTDKQGIVKLYKEILQDAADHQIMVNFHGASMPRGMERTYPNLMTSEAIRGAEGFGQQPRCDQAAWHDAVIPFTRNVVGSMDYTPVTFSNKIRQGVEAFRKTTMTHQLALTVVFESGVQNFADKPEAYLALPEKPLHFMKTVPVAWDETRFVAGYPGDFVVLARRSGKTWYLAGINGKDVTREITISLPFANKIEKLNCITDGVDLNSFGYETITRDKQQSFTIKMAGNGGFVSEIKENK